VPGEAEWIIRPGVSDLTSRSLRGADPRSGSLRMDEINQPSLGDRSVVPATSAHPFSSKTETLAGKPSIAWFLAAKGARSYCVIYSCGRSCGVI